MAKCLQMNSTLQELVIDGDRLPITVTNDIVNKVADNTSVASFQLKTISYCNTKLFGETIQTLLKNNHKIQALEMNNIQRTNSMNYHHH